MPVTVSFIVSGILIDLDHFVDYFMNEGRIRLDIKDFFYKCDNVMLKKFYVPLHSYELFAVLSVIWYFTHSGVMLGLVAGSMVHLIVDAFYNGSHPLTYLFLFRMSRNYDTLTLVKARPKPVKV